MIQGLKVTIPGEVVASLLKKKAEYHHRRSKEYQQTFDTLVGALGPLKDENAPKMSSMRDPRQEAEAGVERHSKNARENEFLSEYVNTKEEYLLDANDLHRLGVLESRY